MRARQLNTTRTTVHMICVRVETYERRARDWVVFRETHQHLSRSEPNRTVLECVARNVVVTHDYRGRRKKGGGLTTTDENRYSATCIMWYKSESPPVRG